MIPMELNGFNVCSFSGYNAWVIFDEVATHCDPCSFGVFLFWSDGANDPGVGDGPALGDLVLVDEVDRVGSLDSVSNSLGKVA